jgi:predicted PurR-regulated permease PerM
MTNDLKVIDVFIRISVLGFILFWCFIFLRPFIGLVLWGTILAIAFNPIFLWLKSLMGGRGALAATVITLVCLGIIVGPVSLMAKVLAENAQSLAASIKAETLVVPPPPEQIKDWPLLGKPLNNIWQLASVNLKQALRILEPQLKDLATNLLAIAANVGLGLLQFILSIIIAAALMVNTRALNSKLTRFVTRLTPTQGQAFVQLASSTLRNVIRGVIGVAALQTLLIGIGLIGAGIPAAGLLTLLCLILTIIQIGPGLVVLPTLIFAWLTMNKLVALLLTVWMIPATLIDNFLKPILMARGLPVPMLVIFIGVIGGTITNGIIGLFIGPVILALGYELMRAWINEDLPPVSSPADGER